MADALQGLAVLADTAHPSVRSTALVAVVKTVNLLLGGLITVYAARAYRRTGSRALRAVAVGFGIVTLGALFAGVSDQILPVATGTALVIEGLFSAAGFGTILYSLYV